MFVFKLNPLGDPLLDETTRSRYPYDSEVITTWPVSRRYCIQKLFYFDWDFKPQPSIFDDRCFKEITKLKVKRRASKSFRQFAATKEYFDVVIGENKFREDILHKKIKPPYSLKKYSSTYCNKYFECPFGKNKNLDLKINGVDQVCRFIQFFNFLFFDKITFTIVYNNEIGLIYFNSSNLLYYIRHLSDHNYLSFYTLSNYGAENIQSSINIKQIFALCTNNVKKCSWYFMCDYNRKKMIEVNKVCDLNFDCINQSDEKYCSSNTHFNCISGFPVSISRSKVNDNQIDCSDRSDECEKNSISSAEEIIKNPNLRKYIWFCTVAIFVFNTIAIVKCYKEIKNVDKTRLVSLYNLIFVFNLSVSDMIFGFVLAILATFSSKFSGHYCLNDLEWRSSLACNVIGMLTIVSSQTSLNILALITGFRLYTVYKPFKDIHDFKNKIVYLLLICWIIPILLSITPIVLQNNFTQSMLVSSNLFLGNKSVDFIVDLSDRTANNQNTSQLSIPLLKNNIKNSSFKSINEMKKQYPNTSFVVKNTFGFYSSSSVCLPDFYSKSLLASRFSCVLMSFNLLMVILISVGYVLIFREIRQSKVNNLSKNRSNNERKFMIRVFMIVATDIVCWLPIIAFTYASYLGLKIPEIVHPLSSIVLLPINSFINPFLYSKVEIVLYQFIKKYVEKCYSCLAEFLKLYFFRPFFKNLKNIWPPLVRYLKKLVLTTPQIFSIYLFFLFLIIISKLSGVSFKLWPYCPPPLCSLWPPNFLKWPISGSTCKYKF